MTAAEIKRGEGPSHISKTESNANLCFWLREIALQLARIAERLEAEKAVAEVKPGYQFVPMK